LKHLDRVTALDEDDEGTVRKSERLRPRLPFPCRKTAHRTKLRWQTQTSVVL
jgi:hypothetical protein